MIKVEDGLLFPSCIIAYLLFSCLNDFFLLWYVSSIKWYIQVFMYYFSVCECPQMSVFTYISQPPPYFKCLHPSAILAYLADFITSYPLLWSIYRNRGRWGGGGGYEKNGWDSPKDGRINPFCTLCNMCFIFFYYGQ